MSYSQAKEQYARLGIDTDAAIKKLKTVPVALPPELTVIREVTADPAYQNAALAEAIPAD